MDESVVPINQVVDVRAQRSRCKGGRTVPKNRGYQPCSVVGISDWGQIRRRQRIICIFQSQGLKNGLLEVGGIRLASQLFDDRAQSEKVLLEYEYCDPG